MTQFAIEPQLATLFRRKFFQFAPNLPVTLAILIFLVISVLAFRLVATLAVAEVAGPEAPGSIMGVVKTSGGAPQIGIEVTLFDRTGNALRTVTTQGDGVYRFSLLPAGVYRIGISRPQAGYAPLYYPAVPTVFKAADINVAGNQVTGTDLSLQPAAQITGIITMTQGLTLTRNSVVSLFQQGQMPNSAFWSTIQTIDLPAASGVYTFTGLSADHYRICASAYTFAFAIYECYDNVATVERAASITVSVGGTIHNINLTLGDNADAPIIQGQVTALNNEPLAGIDVYAMFIPPTTTPLPTGRSTIVTPTLTLPSPPIFDPNYYGATVSTRTNGNGNYQLGGLNEGRYRLFFGDATGVYGFAYYKDAVSWEQATLIDLAAGQVISGVNTQLRPGSQIYGAITLLGQSAIQGRVIVEMKIATGWQYVVNGLVELNDGSYKIGGLPAGTYRVSAVSEIYDGITSYVYSGYFGGKDAATATAFTLTAGEAKQADIPLTGGPLFEGGVTGRVTAGGSPLAGATVVLYKNPIACCIEQLSAPQVSVLTNQDGYYTINGLPPGSYQLGVTDPTGVYATTYYTAHAVPSIANSLSIKESNVLTNVNLDLPLAAAIRGRVTTRKGQPVAGLSVLVYANPHSERTVNFWALVSSGAHTDTNGQYTIHGLHANTYHVCFLGMNNILHCHGSLDTSDPSSLVANAAPVTVVAGETKANVDLLWGPALRYHLPIAKR